MCFSKLLLVFSPSLSLSLFLLLLLLGLSSSPKLYDSVSPLRTLYTWKVLLFLPSHSHITAAFADSPYRCPHGLRGSVTPSVSTQPVIFLDSSFPSQPKPFVHFSVFPPMISNTQRWSRSICFLATQTCVEDTDRAPTAEVNRKRDPGGGFALHLPKDTFAKIRLEERIRRGLEKRQTTASIQLEFLGQMAGS